jgi:hypothetical protein
MMYIGDFLSQATVYFYFTTHKADGTPITIAGSPTVRVYKDNNTTETTTGPTLTVGFDSVVGLHCVAIETTDAFYTTGHDYKVVLTGTGTVDSVSVTGYMLGSFSIENRFANPASIALEKAGIAGAKMDIADAPSATGLAALADAILTRAFSSVTYTGTTRCILTALQVLRNKFTVATGAAGYVVKKEDDTTTSWTGVVTADGNGVITGMDPDS